MNGLTLISFINQAIQGVHMSRLFFNPTASKLHGFSTASVAHKYSHAPESSSASPVRHPDLLEPPRPLGSLPS